MMARFWVTGTGFPQIFKQVEVTEPSMDSRVRVPNVFVVATVRDFRLNPGRELLPCEAYGATVAARTGLIVYGYLLTTFASNGKRHVSSALPGTIGTRRIGHCRSFTSQ